MQTVIKPIIGSGKNDTFVYLGFCPDVVEVINYTGKIIGLWSRLLGNDAHLCLTPTESDDNGSVPTAEDDEGIKLVQMKGPGIDQSSDPSAVTDPNLADGIQLTGDWGDGVGNGISAGDLIWIKAYRATQPFVLATHDGGDASGYLQDKSVDFLEAGVSGGQMWIAINITNGDYAYVGEVQKPFGESKYNYCTLVDSNGDAIGATAADVDDDDEFILMPKNEAQYPLSDIGLMA